MINRRPLELVRLDFFDCTYLKRKDYDCNEVYFQHEIAMIEPSPQHLLFGKRLSLRSTPALPVGVGTGFVILQLLHSNCLHFARGSNDEPRVRLHDFLGVAWRCSVVREELAAGNSVFCVAERLQEIDGSMALDMAFDTDHNHCFEKNHLALLLTEAEFQELMEADVNLYCAVMEDMELFDEKVMLGETVQKSRDNYADRTKARKISRRVFGNIDHATLKVSLIDPNADNVVCLKNNGVLPTPARLDFSDLAANRTLRGFVTPL